MAADGVAALVHMGLGDFRLLQAGPASRFLPRASELVAGFRITVSCSLTCVVFTVQKEVPSGADDLLEHYGLSGIYKLFTARGHDTYLKGLPADLDFRRYVAESGA